MTKEELKQEAEDCMHDALFWLKLPISKENVGQGGSYILKLLEPREKQLQEKDKKIAELESKYYSISEIAHHRGMCCISALRENRELEKENAELKERYAIINLNANIAVRDLNDQLTKAKEIIKKLYAVYYDPCITESDLKYRDELFAEIKQFLKDSEVEK